MKKYVYLILIILIFSGCGAARFIKVKQLFPQKTIGWVKSSAHTFQYKCNQGEVKVSPVVISFDGEYDVSLGVPISATKKELAKKNQADASTYIEFRNVDPIESCELSYISLENQRSGSLFAPTSSMDIPSKGLYKEKYTHGCHYYFDIDKTSKADYLLHVSEEVLGCNINPIPLNYEKSSELETREWM